MSYRGLASGSSPAGRSDRADYDPFRADSPQMRRSKSPGPGPGLNPGPGPAPGTDQFRERRAGGHPRLYQTNSGGQSSTSLHSMASHLGSSPLSRERTTESDSGSAMLRGRQNDDRRLGDAASVRSARSPGRIVDESDTEVEKIIRTIETDWDFMAGECVPVQAGLQLMDTSTLGKADREPEFFEAYRDIQKALKSVVNNHHQGFNSSIGTYHKIQSSIQSSQSRIRSIKNALTEAKAGLLTTKPELKGLAMASQNYDDILQIFGLIEHIQALPEKLEARLSEKRFISAVEILQEALRLIRRSELESIGGLSDLRTYFNNQEASLTDILVEELHDHLYLKSPYCQDRWKNSSLEDPAEGSNSWDRPVYRFLARLDLTTPLTEDASRNPEAETFHYMHTILEALFKLGDLDVAIDRIQHRLPVELFSVVDKTGTEVTSRHPDYTPPTSSRDQRTTATPAGLDVARAPVLSEFMWDLYSKFAAIAEGHRVCHDIIVGIKERQGKSVASQNGFKELWKLYQSEIRSLLHDYLATDGDVTFGALRRQDDVCYSVNSVHRDRQRKMFKMSEVSQKSAGVKSAQQDLDEILQTSVPGLVSKSRLKPATSNTARARQENSATGHKLLIEPSVFNISIVLPPSLSFIQRLKDIVPINTDIALSTLTSFLDDFLINVFQPQLEEAVTDLCTMNLIAPDAFMEDSQWVLHSPKPVFKGTVGFANLVKLFSRMLDTIPHDQVFTQVVINQIVAYYDKTYQWYRSLVSRIIPQKPDTTRLKAAAAFAEGGEIREVTQQLWESDSGDRQGLVNKEVELLLQYTNKNPLEPHDIVSDPRTVTSLSLLYNSMHWLINNLQQLRHVEDSANSSRPPSSHQNTRRWTLISSGNLKWDSFTEAVFLPMTPVSVVTFDNMMNSLRGLALTTLLTLHIDIRCGTIHMITRNLAGSNVVTVTNSARKPSISVKPPTKHAFYLPTAPTAASQAIIDLNNDLIAFDANISSSLGGRECRFITSGLAKLTDHAFLSGMRHVGTLNTNGALKLQLDVLVLQQNLKNIIVCKPEAGGQRDSSSRHHKQRPSVPFMSRNEQIALPRTAKFLDWFLAGAKVALSYAKTEKETFEGLIPEEKEAKMASDEEVPFTYDELKLLVELCYSAALKGPGAGEENREGFIAAKKGREESLAWLDDFKS